MNVMYLQTGLYLVDSYPDAGTHRGAPLDQACLIVKNIKC
jgi:hypothetical protein